MRRAVYEIVQRPSPGKALIIRDLGPWDRHPTVTNDAEAVVAELASMFDLGRWAPLWYYDSEGELAELLIENGQFSGFAPVKIGTIDDQPGKLRES